MAKKMTDAEKAEAAKKREAANADAAAKDKPAPAAKPKVKAAVVTVKTVRGVNSRWRAGYGFGPEPREIPADDLSEDQLEALESDPSLVVSLEG